MGEKQDCWDGKTLPFGEDCYDYCRRVFFNRWKPRIIHAIQFDNDCTRFARFTRQLPISEKVLAQNLRELEEDGLRVLGSDDPVNRVGVVSVDFLCADNAEMTFRLEREYGIQTRCGLHCAPLAHKTLGTFPQGAVRFSVGPFTTFEELDYVHGAVYDLLLEVGNQ